MWLGISENIDVGQGKSITYMGLWGYYLLLWPLNTLSIPGKNLGMGQPPALPLSTMSGFRKPLLLLVKPPFLNLLFIFT